MPWYQQFRDREFTLIFKKTCKKGMYVLVFVFLNYFSSLDKTSKDEPEINRVEEYYFREKILFLMSFYFSKSIKGNIQVTPSKFLNSFMGWANFLVLRFFWLINLHMYTLNIHKRLLDILDIFFSDLSEWCNLVRNSKKPIFEAFLVVFFSWKLLNEKFSLLLYI